MTTAGFHKLSLADVRPETEGAVCLRFEVPDALSDRYRFKQGQYLTLLSTIDGEDLRRSYSICSGVDEDKLEVAIKAVEGGRFSTFANASLKTGDTLEVMPPEGSFYTEL